MVANYECYLQELDFENPKIHQNASLLILAKLQHYISPNAETELSEYLENNIHDLTFQSF